MWLNLYGDIVAEFVEAALRPGGPSPSLEDRWWRIYLERLRAKREWLAKEGK